MLSPGRVYFDLVNMVVLTVVSFPEVTCSYGVRSIGCSSSVMIKDKVNDLSHYTRLEVVHLFTALENCHISHRKYFTVNSWKYSLKFANGVATSAREHVMTKDPGVLFSIIGVDPDPFFAG